MRISSSYTYQTLQAAIANTSETQNLYAQQLATGKAIAQASDNPLGTSQSMSMQTIKDQLTQYNTNLTSASSFLTQTESSLGDAQTIAQTAYQYAVTGANSATSQDTRTTLVAQITQLENQLVSVANAQDSNQKYIFGGQKTATAPYTVSNNQLVYSGDTNDISVQGGPAESVTITTQASSQMTSLYSQLETLKNDLSNGSVSTLSNTDVANLQASANALGDAQGSVGAKLQTVQTLTANNTRRSTEMQTEIASYQQVDYATVEVQYQQAQTAYTAALQVTSSSFQNSLLNFIKGQ